MSSLRLFFRSSQSCLRSPRPAYPLCQRRALSNSLPRFSELAPEPETLEEIKEAEDIEKAFEAQMEADAEEDANPAGGSELAASYRNFMDTVAVQYKTAQPGGWLGRNGPFPLNPSFLPPPPLSDALKDQIYDAYMKDPVKNNLRVLSQRFHVSLKRVDAILRLKGMERAWLKGKPLQTGFLRGMERLLQVRRQDTNPKPGEYRHPRYDVSEADSLEEAENRDAARQRYQRSYWETTPEQGGEPIVPAALEHAKRTAIRMAERARKEKDARYLKPIADTKFIKWPKQHFLVAKKAGRPDVHFIDVGAKFVDSTEEDQRLTRASARGRIKVKRREKKAVNATASS